jgi:hypothetical protein
MQWRSSQIKIFISDEILGIIFNFEVISSWFCNFKSKLWSLKGSCRVPRILVPTFSAKDRNRLIRRWRRPKAGSEDVYSALGVFHWKRIILEKIKNKKLENFWTSKRQKKKHSLN